MTIHFYLANSNETPITSFHGLTSNPFNIGDEVLMTVSDLLPKELLSYAETGRPTLNLRIENETLKESFNNGGIKLKREVKHMRFNVLMEPELTIEYYCTRI